MLKFKTKSKSIMNKMLFPMIFIIIIQTGLFFGTFWFGGSIKQLNNNAFDILNERVINRKNYIQNEMLQRWTNISRTVETVNLEVSSILTEYGIDTSLIEHNSEISSKILSEVSDDIVALLRKNSVTGAFIILEGEKSSQHSENKTIEKSGVYIRDLDPMSNPSDTSDLLIERAPSSVTKELGLQMDSWWIHNFQFTPDYEEKKFDFYYKPFRAALEYPEISYSDLGYWSRPFKLTEKDIDIITYSVPLISDDGNPYGVLGIEVSLDYLRSFMPYDEIGGNKSGSYMLAVKSGDEVKFDNAVGSGSSYKYIIGDAKEIMFEEKAVYKNSYKLNNNNFGKGETAFGCIQYFKLYNTNTPFVNDEWALIGLIEESSLLGFISNIKTSVFVSFIVSFAIGVIGVLIMSKLFTRPISRLVENVKSSNPRLPVKFDKIDITEIDDLSAAIENLSHNVADSASRLSQIIEMSSIAIGAFEFNKITNEIFYTESLFELLGMNVKTITTASQFEDIMKGLEKNLEEEIPNENAAIYKINKNGSKCWIRINKIEDNIKVLGVVIDKTKETKEKKKIEHERDYDLLTGLINRRAFHQILEEKFREPEKLGVCAVVMLDLDNLKYINDTYGHDYGDEYIKCAARILKKYSPYRCIVARMSGDEFYVFIHGFEGKEGIRAIVENIKKSIRASKFCLPDGKIFKIRASAGLSWYPEDSTSFEQLIKYADFSMYTVKNTVKGEFQEFDIQVYNRDSYLLHSKDEFNKLIEEDMVTYHFQPIVDTVTGEIYAYEALMRSNSEILKSPLEILNMAKSQFKLYQIEKLTWFKALSAFSGLKGINKNCKVFINSIPNQILKTEDVMTIEKNYGDYLDRIVLELTEEEKLNDEFTLQKQVYIKKWNGKFALDDYGTGYNGEAMLLAMTPDFIKIDMSIVRNIDKDENRLRLFQNIASYSKKLGIKIIAEGVETSEELNVLVLNGADYIQGYYLSMPRLIPETIPEVLKNEIRSIRLK